MGTLSDLAGQRLYLDANLFIYGLENIPEWGEATRALLGAVDTGAVTGVTSELTLAECLVRPIQLGRADIVEAYIAAIQPRSFLTVVPVSRQILIEAARQRATRNLKLPDAIHLVTASQSGCHVFVTNDKHLNAVEGITLVQLSDWVS